jgi:hypothetical protein
MSLDDTKHNQQIYQIVILHRNLPPATADALLVEVAFSKPAHVV